MPNTQATGVAYSDPEFTTLSVTGATTLTGAITATGGKFRIAVSDPGAWCCRA